jgi:hypothetical protein
MATLLICRLDSHQICNVFQKDHILKLVAVKFIPKGSAISSHYVSSVNGTFRRQSQLQKKWYFACTCQRCTDPVRS